MAADFMRIGDVERDEAVNMLREHHATGRLTSEEFDDRMSKALGARTQSELNELFLDLPAPKPNAGSNGGPASYAEPQFTYDTPAASPTAPAYGATDSYGADPYGTQDPYAPAPYGVSDANPYAPLEPAQQSADVAQGGTPWYAQWWMVIVAVFVAGMLDTGAIIILAALWVWVIYPNLIGKRRQLPRPSPAGPPRPLTYMEREWVMEELRKGNKILAIKRYRELTGADLRTAKNTVETWGRQIGR
ncbi:MAG: DUF1707 domain-containing protein [Propionibacteriaceae bacterium]|nr:DUF1707 domain-containing protein [Propionibacteriaceae bacterium]